MEEVLFEDMRIFLCIWQHDANYFGPIASANLFSGQWTCIQGAVSVTSDDIHRGNFYWMLDCIDPTDNQVIYIDDFDIFKLYDNPDKNSNNSFIINDKPYIKGYPYWEIGNRTGEEAVDWYFEHIGDYPVSSMNEMVYTLTREKIEQFQLKLTYDIERDWLNSMVKDELANAIDANRTLLGAFSSEIGYIFTGEEILNSMNANASKFKADLTVFSNHLSMIKNTSNHTQDRLTYSIYLMRNDYFDGYQYRIMRSDGILKSGNINRELYYLLSGYCSEYYDLTTYNRPSVNRIFVNYSYLSEEYYYSLISGGSL